MEAKEKAKELMSKFVGISLSQVNELVDGIRIRLAKDSALIAVDEILTEMSEYFDRYDCTETLAKIEYWTEVKTHLISN